MTHYVAQLGPTTLVHDDGSSVRFVPKGKLRAIGEWAEENPAKKRSGNALLAARFFVGFNVGNEPTYTIEDVVEFFAEIRNEQDRDAGASFLIQKGIYQPRGGSRTEEDSAQIIVFNDEGIDEEVFTDEMIVVAEKLAKKMKQEVVILEIQKRGVTVDAYTVTP